MRFAVSWMLFGILAAVVGCSSGDKIQEKSARDKYTPVYEAQGPFDAAIAGAFVLMMSSPQGGSQQDKNQISGTCKIRMKEKDEELSKLCNGVEVFLYSPDGRILQRTWAFDGAYRLKVATAGPYIVKARHAEANLSAELAGVRRGQILNLELVKK